MCRVMRFVKSSFYLGVHYGTRSCSHAYYAFSNNLFIQAYCVSHEKQIQCTIVSFRIISIRITAISQLQNSKPISSFIFACKNKPVFNIKLLTGIHSSYVEILIMQALMSGGDRPPQGTVVEQTKSTAADIMYAETGNMAAMK